MENTAEKTIPLTRIQKLIGKVMLESKHTMPCCYIERDVDVTALVKRRKAWCKEVGVRVSTNDFFYLAIARSIERFPLIAASLDNDDQELKVAEHIGVGFAVAAPQGLVVPVIQNMAAMTLLQIGEQSDMLLKKARANKLVPDDFDGANIVLSSLGMFGIDSFYAIAPLGATGIIAMGRISETPVYVDGTVQKRRMLSLSLTTNRMVVDEAYAAKFLADIAQQLENPESLTN
jgi:pyruvate dehydrogenase E2 component (dihydrolipoamide acetyltransferase)